jgi:hypothetical protein
MRHSARSPPPVGHRRANHKIPLNISRIHPTTSVGRTALLAAFDLEHPTIWTIRGSSGNQSSAASTYRKDARQHESRRPDLTARQGVLDRPLIKSPTT